MASVRARVLVSGLVQGVFFRASTYEKAKELGLFGWVRNLPDGRVEAVFEGNEAKVKEAVEWCRRGPPAARVSGVEVEYSPVLGDFSDFKIRRYSDM